MRETGRENTTTLNDWIVPFARACSGGQRPKSFSIVSWPIFSSYSAMRGASSYAVRVKWPVRKKKLV